MHADSKGLTAGNGQPQQFTPLPTTELAIANQQAGAKPRKVKKQHTTKAKKKAEAKKASAPGGPASPAEAAQKKPTVTLQSRPLTEIQERDMKWLWPHVLPLGKVIIFEGDPGQLKSFVLMDLAARVSSHGQMPDGSHGQWGKVLILAGDDDEEDTVKPRLMAAGADPANVECLSTVVEDGKLRPLLLPRDLELLEAKIKAMGAVLVILDPLFDFLEDMQ